MRAAKHAAVQSQQATPGAGPVGHLLKLLALRVSHLLQVNKMIMSLLGCDAAGGCVSLLAQRRCSSSGLSCSCAGCLLSRSPGHAGKPPQPAWRWLVVACVACCSQA